MSEQEIISIKKDIVVTLDYDLEVDGDLIDSGPIQFLFGYGNIIPGLESEIEGMKLGEEKEILVSAENAYGNYEPDLEVDFPLSSFPEDFEIKIGKPMRLHDDKGHTFTGVATELSSDTVKIDLNHPLAGKDLLFRTAVKDLRQATEEEMEHRRPASACSGCSSGGCSGCE